METILVCGTLLQAIESQGKPQLEYREHVGILIGSDGMILEIDDPGRLRSKAGKVFDYGKSLIMPGFIDTHVHFPQIDLIGAYSGALIEWLDQHTFPHEIKFNQNLPLAEKAAIRFCRELYSNGVSMAGVFACSKEASTNALFEAFAKTGGRLISGKISMDQNAPEALLDQLDLDLEASHRLAEKWHGWDGRISYGFSPRFVPSCSREMLAAIASLRKKFPGSYLQTHYAENQKEIEWVKSLFPKSQDYLGVYEDFDLVDARTILAHSIHTSDSEKGRLADKKVAISHCPTSNLFLGSGLFSWVEHRDFGVQITLGTDVGAGTSFSMWQTMAEAIKISKLRDQQILPEEAIYGATLGAAKALDMADRIGSLEPGKCADFQVIDPHRRSLLSNRLEYCTSTQQLASALIFIADDRNHLETWVQGRKVWSQDT